MRMIIIELWKSTVRAEKITPVASLSIAILKFQPCNQQRSKISHCSFGRDVGKKTKQIHTSKLLCFITTTG